MAACIAATGCATAPVPPDAAPEILRISTHTWFEVSPGRSDHTEALPGAQCTASNDRGTWTLATPGELQVLRSNAPLRIECHKPGYSDARVEMRCLTPRSQGAMGGARGALAIAAMSGPAAIVVLPAVGLAVAAIGAVAVVGGGAGAAAAGTQPNADLCAYGAAGDLEIWMRKAW